MKIIIVGAGEVGSHLAKMLSNAENEITVIDPDPERLQNLSAVADIVAIEGKPTAIKVLEAAGAAEADLMIAVYPAEEQDVNILTSLLAKKLGTKKVAARINSEENLSYENKYRFTEMGIDLMFYPQKIAASEIMERLSHNGAVESVEFAKGKLQMDVFKIDEGSPLAGMTVQEFSEKATPEAVQFRIVAIERSGQTIRPRYDTKLKFRDLLYIIAKKEVIRTLHEYTGKDNMQVNSVMIIGGSKTGKILAREISKRMDKVKLIETNRDRCAFLAEKLPPTVSVINGDGRNSDLLMDENITSFDAFVAVTNNSEVNILSCVAAKNMGVAHTVALVENMEYIKLAEGMGVDHVINKKLITASKISRLTMSDKVRLVKYLGGTSAEVIEFMTAPGAKITKDTLAGLDFPEDAIVGGVIRGSESFIAVGSTRIQAYDRVIVFALPDVARTVDKWFK